MYSFLEIKIKIKISKNEKIILFIIQDILCNYV